MVSSIRQTEIDELKAQKKIDRAKEVADYAEAEAQLAARKKASDDRIAKKMAIIEAGGVVPNPEPVVQPVKKQEVIEEKVEKKVEEKVEEPKKKVAKKKVTKKKAAKKK
tara:strand:- start:1244 stop:1570 length:327 start_codon:yes stop_codon:yes gene_type:complete